MAGTLAMHAPITPPRGSTLGVCRATFPLSLSKVSYRSRRCRAGLGRALGRPGGTWMVLRCRGRSHRGPGLNSGDGLYDVDLRGNR